MTPWKPGDLRYVYEPVAERSPLLVLWETWVTEQIRIENEALEELLVESIRLAEFDRLDRIFIAEFPDGSRSVCSWWEPMTCCSAGRTKWPWRRP